MMPISTAEYCFKSGAFMTTPRRRAQPISRRLLLYVIFPRLPAIYQLRIMSFPLMQSACLGRRRCRSASSLVLIYHEEAP